MSLRKSLHKNKALRSAQPSFYRRVRIYFVLAGIFSAFTAFYSITDFFAREALAQTNVNKRQITPTPTPSPLPPVVFTVSPMVSASPDDQFSAIAIQFGDSDRFPPIEIESPDAVWMAIVGIGLIGVIGGLRARWRTPLMDLTETLLKRSVSAALANAGPQEHEEVLCTLFAPDDVRQGDAFLVQAFAHVAEQTPVLGKIARLADLAAIERGSENLGIVERSEQLSLYLEMPGLEIDEPEQSLTWNGEITSLKFGVTVPVTFKPRSINCKLLVSRNKVPIGHVRFTLRVSAIPRAEVSDIGLKAYQEFVRYRLAFISYASADRSEVLKRVQMLDFVKVGYFQDLLSLEAGKQWEPLVYRYIDECDVFYLFWSTAAKKSKWVKKEVRHALKRKGRKLERPPEIMPIPIEGPPPVKPPRYLSAIHFDSRFLYFINPRDLQRAEGPVSSQPILPAASKEDKGLVMND